MNLHYKLEVLQTFIWWGTGYILECMGRNPRTACESWNSPSTMNLLSLLDAPGSVIAGHQLRMFVKNLTFLNALVSFMKYE